MSKIGRNDPCPCGSGKKYKQCCMPAATSRPSPPQPAESQINAALAAAVRHIDAGNLDEAVTLCKRVLQHAPNNHAALNLLGILAYQADNDMLAVDLLKRAVTAKPDYTDAYNNLGAVLRDMGRFQEALQYLDKALKANPHYLDALINYGNTLQDIGQHAGSLTFYRRALQINPAHTGALSNLGNALQELHRHQEAAETFEHLLTIDPDYEYAQGSRLFSKLHVCDWNGYETGIRHVLQAIEAGGKACKPFDLLAFTDSPSHQQTCAKAFAREKFPEPARAGIPRFDHMHDRIRVAYLSADFREHPVSQLLVQLIEQHDRSRFEVFGFSYGVDDQSGLRKRIVAAFDHFIEVRQKSDREVAALLREHEIDIAIDLMGFTTDSRLGILARRSAPVQASFLGYAGTTGTDYIDYIIADRIVIPDGAQDYFTESPVYLPECFQPNDTQRPIAATPSRKEAGLPEDSFVFCVFNNTYKITPTMFDIWMRLLLQVSGSVLWLARANDVVKNNLRMEAEKRGVSAARLIFAERTPELADHLARQRLADLFLDTFPYNAHTTASDALWAGLPVLSCMGRSYASRVAGSLLQAVGLPELAVSTLQDYEAMATQLATDKARLGAIRSRLAENIANAPLFDMPNYRNHYEEALLGMKPRHLTCS